MKEMKPTTTHIESAVAESNPYRANNLQSIATMLAENERLKAGNEELRAALRELTSAAIELMVERGIEDARLRAANTRAIELLVTVGE